MGRSVIYSAKSILGPAVDGIFIQSGTGTVAHGSIPVDNTAEPTESLFALYDFGTSGTLKGCRSVWGKTSRASARSPVPRRTIVDAAITYQYGKHLKSVINIDNLLDKKYIYSVRSENVQVPGSPFNLKFSLSYSL